MRIQFRLANWQALDPSRSCSHRSQDGLHGQALHDLRALRVSAGTFGSQVSRQQLVLRSRLRRTVMPGTIRIVLGFVLLILAGSVDDTLSTPSFIATVMLLAIPGTGLALWGISA